MPALTFSFFFFNDTATTEIYTLSLHDALPISCTSSRVPAGRRLGTKPPLAPTGTMSVFLTFCAFMRPRTSVRKSSRRSEEHTSELQSRLHLVCRLLLEKKKQKINIEICTPADE